MAGSSDQQLIVNIGDEEKELREQLLNKYFNVLGSNLIMTDSKMAINSQRSMLSHLRILTNNNINVLNQNDLDNLRQNGIKILNELRRKDNTKLTATYKYAICNTLTHFNVKINTRIYRKEIQENKKLRRSLTHEQKYKRLKNNLLYLMNVKKSFDQIVKDNVINDFGQYQMLVASLIVKFFGIRSSEIFAIKYKHIELIKNGSNRIRIATKTSTSREILSHDDTREFCSQLLSLRDAQRLAILQYSTDDKRKRIQERERFSYAILFSVSQLYRLQKTFTGIHQSGEIKGFSELNQFVNISFNEIRATISTMMYNNGNYELAQIYNNHKNKDTTSHYIRPQDSSDGTVKSIYELFND